MTKKISKLRRYYWCLMVIFIALLIIGTVNVFSATFVDDRLNGNSYNHLIKQGFFIVIGGAIFTIFYRNDYHIWRKYIKGEIIVMLLVLGAVLFVGTVVNGSRRWISIGPLSFQPSELAKLVSIIYASHYIASFLERQRTIEFLYTLSNKKKDTGIGKFLQKFHWIPHVSLWGPLVMASLVIVQPDAGTAIVIFGIPAFMLLISGAHILKLKKTLLCIMGAFVVMVIQAPYRLERIRIWLNPEIDPQNAGYQSMQGLIAISTGHLTGQGIGGGVSKFGSLPEAATDFAFAVLAQEWGLFGTLLVIALFLAVSYFGILTSLHCNDKFGSLLALGMTLYLGGQGFINIAMVSGVLPVVGVPLPFISYGGTSLVVNMIAAAVLLNISKQNYRCAEKEYMQYPMPPRRSLKEETRSQFPLKPDNP